jgi:two-component system CheB/CheR fusion protein
VGLFVTRELVRAHGGEIAVESQEGVGATFIVRLPLVE